MIVSARARAAAMVAAGSVLVIGPFVVPSSAQEQGLIGYLGVADSDVVAQTGGDPSAQGYPQVQAKTAHTFTSLDTGENGRALASSQWPGEFVGNAGSLLQVFGAPEEAGALNYPVRAEASTVGPAAASQPGMTARVEGPVAEAIATSGDFDGDGSDFFTFGDIRSVSRSELIDRTLVVTATAIIADIDIGGVIAIDSVETTAIARTDGSSGSNEGTTVVSGLEIAGLPARVDENGVRAGDGTTENPADAVAQTVIDDALSNFADAFEVTVFLSKPRSTDDGNLQEHRSGSLVIDFTAGDPEAGQGGDGVIALGGSNAYAQATSGVPFAATPLPTPVAAPFDPSSGSSPTQTSERGPSRSSGGSEATAPTSSVVAVVNDETAAAPILETAPIVARFGGLGFLMPIIVVLGGLIAGRGLHRFHAAVNAPGAPDCIIDGGEP